MIIDLIELPEEGKHFVGVEPPEVMEMDSSVEFRIAGPLEYDLFVQMVDEMLIVRGTVSAPVEACCARCTQIFSTTVGDSGFLRDYSDLQGAEEVDVTEDLREEIILNLPRFPLCDEACRGLCPQCGKNLNGGPCGCPEKEKGGAWDALNSLNL